MANTVNTSFNEFNSAFVNLLPDRTTKARASRDWLFGQLNNLDGKADLDFPFKYEDKNIKYGSFARNTKIRELDDVDLMFCLTADGAFYLKNHNEYIIHTPNAGQRLKSLSDFDVLNSRRVVNKLKLSLSKVDQYKAADINNRGEAATLSLQSYEWVFDIVPCFYTDTNLYLIPDGQGNWKATDPRIDQNLVTAANQNYNGRVLQLIRTLKYWNSHNSSFTIPSYLFEQIILNFVSLKTELSTWIDFDIRDFFRYLQSSIYNAIQDPKGLQGDLNSLSFHERQSVSQKSIWAYAKAKEATDAETQESDQQKAINKWREIFGPKFPIYG